MPTLAVGMFFRDFSSSYEREHGTRQLFQRAARPRDLGSGMQLAWLPVANQAKETAIAVLKELFAKRGPPLVLKSDNSSAFKSDHFQSLLRRRGVAWLPSPPANPGIMAVARRARGTSTNAPSTSPAAPVAGRRSVFRPPRPKPMNSSGPAATASHAPRVLVRPATDRFAHAGAFHRRDRTPSARDPPRAPRQVPFGKQKPSTPSATSGRVSSTPRTRPVNHRQEVNSSTN